MGRRLLGITRRAAFFVSRRFTLLGDGT